MKQLELLEWQPAPRTHAELIRRWEERLAAEGMRAELPSFHHDAESRARAVINAGVMELARAYLDRARFPTSLERRAWRLFAIEGATVREIAEQLGTAKSHIGRILLRHKRKAGIP